MTSFLSSFVPRPFPVSHLAASTSGQSPGTGRGLRGAQEGWLSQACRGAGLEGCLKGPLVVACGCVPTAVCPLGAGGLDLLTGSGLSRCGR